MSVSLARRLVAEGVLPAEEVNTALRTHVLERVAFLEEIVRQRPELIERLEAELGCPRSDAMPAIVPDAELTRRVPEDLLSTLLAIPVGRDPSTQAIRVVAADPSDPHVESELSHHLREPVRVSPAPLSAVLAVFARRLSAAPDTRAYRTPAFGMQSPAPEVVPRAHGRPSALPIAEPVLRPSAPPIPLVRLSPEPAHAHAPATVHVPATVKGVAPQAVGAVHATRVIVPPRAPAAVAAEPVIELTRAKSSPSAGASKPARLSPVPSSPSAAPDPRSAPEAFGVEAALREFEEASSPEDVVTVLVRGLSGVATHVVVLAARGKVFEGRDSNLPAFANDVRALVISGDRPNVLLTATQTGHYLGPIPQTLVHAELSRILGSPESEIGVGIVTVSGRPALVYVLGGMGSTYLATRTGDQLAAAAARALERIVRQRKK